jgi:hypothetical protein
MHRKLIGTCTLKASRAYARERVRCVVPWAMTSETMLRCSVLRRPLGLDVSCLTIIEEHG